MWILRLKPSSKHLQYLNYSTQPIHNHFMVDYLVNSVGFSKDQALSALPDLTHLKSTQNPDSVLHFLKHQCCLDNTQVRNIVSYRPKILTTSVHKTLAPKFTLLQQLGLRLPAPGLEKLVKQSNNFSSNRLGANVSFLRELLGGCDDKVSKVIQRSWWMLSSNYAHKLSSSLLVLKKNGLSDDKIQSILLKNPACLLQNPQWLEATITKVEPVLGVPPESPRFLDGLEIIISLSKSTLDMKFGIFRSFGWSDSEILTMTKALPFCLRSSEARIQLSLNFFMNELGYTPAYLATHPKLLVYSLEKRVMPRTQVLNVLRENKLLKKNFSLCSIAALSEEKFLKDFVLPYREFVPHLFEAYTKATGHQVT
ncbi:putative transcription regulator mTERF family [Helianthus annuus]|uniref:Transcription regulator mTERF family n=1 Tax=Helianthus annuus TaxID=4232 RepID=A0A9K3IZ27_HELAN|nr:uncharacterized protein LOC110940805 [Helianthus annuus]KAF5805706.1 putative transcription regulator mTERF family [Helianthus annuus]KAJ0570091.1 putative transcription regulator mTERF family [Helianthus annuus]KAJ0576826.1 putative transcription regulator mTERF family [Helianthus annuus]KAJ0584423.1 putative transcription regulator mTERF family [Helianthus annuus]KAJ0747048.1 putative transcription regulator mTERF family [Helianthus annuus]